MVVFDREWFDKHQSRLLDFVNDPMLKPISRKILRIDDSREILAIHPNALFFDGPKPRQRVGEFRTQDKYSRRLYYGLRPIWHAAHVWDLFSSPVPELNLGFDTLTKYCRDTAAAQDYSPGRNGVDETFSDIRTGVGTGSGGTVSLTCSETTNQFTSLYRKITCFDTSALGSGFVSILSAIESMYYKSKTQLIGKANVDLVSSSPVDSSNITGDDFPNLGSTAYATIEYDSIGSGYNDWTLDAAGLAQIITNGITKLGFRSSWDRTGTFGGTWQSSGYYNATFEDASYTGTTRDPKLVITYEYGAPPLINIF